MSYKEWKDSDGFFYKGWRNDAGAYHRGYEPAYICYYPDGSIKEEAFYLAGKLHRESGPAIICYYPDGSITYEAFYIDGNIIGFDKTGFWRLWDRLNEEERKAPNLIKYLARYL